MELAITEGVDLLALSGDVIDQENKYYEATGPLERGVRRLAEAGIPVVAVAGNHDYDVLPRVFKDLGSENATLLGAGGRWERHTIHKDGKPTLHVDGWSFPSQRYLDDPLHGYSPEAADGVPTLGLLHGDLEQPRSVYAPVRLADLERLPHAFWLLGHVHVPARHGGRILYPGSPQAMDPGESGAHGAWLLEIEDGRCEARQIPLSTVRYEVIEVDVTDVTDALEVHSRVRAAVKSALAEVEENGCGPLRFFSCRVRLTGRTPLHRKLGDEASELAAEAQIPGTSTVSALIERISVDTRPALSLPDLARVNDAPGNIAKLLLALEDGSLNADQEALLRSAERWTGEVGRARSFSSLPNAPTPDPANILKDLAYLLLDEMMASKERV